ncbi:MAG: hypothetical protein MI924_37615 [Chloroflexales bacterium]|nr:hypothetical protein [Chloroflexales bacterium]
MAKNSTLQSTWVGAFGEHPIRVEEHWYDLSYIVEFYDDLQSEQRQCISHCPNSGDVLSLEELQKRGLRTAGQ